MFIKGRVVLVDDEWLYRLSQYNWFITRDGYVVTRIGPQIGERVPPGKKLKDMYKIVYMHQMVMAGKIPFGFEVDHKNMVKTDNREQNLRAMTHSNNMLNMLEKRPGKVRGVYKSGRKFTVILRLPYGPLEYFGTFETKQEADEYAINKYAEIHEDYFRLASNF